MCDSQGSNDPTTYDLPKPTCEQRLWKHGETVWCGQSVAVITWQDFGGTTHHACPKHIDGLRHRNPEYLPDALPNRGTLGLSSPWARSAFGPADRVEIRNLIPYGWTIGVGVTPNRSHLILWALDASGTERARWTSIAYAHAIAGTFDFARYIAALATEPAMPEGVAS